MLASFLTPQPKTQKAMLRALAGEVLPTPPFWLMRQAGRYLPEYRALRAQAGSFLNLCFNPEQACEVTLQPLRRFDMDAAIIFSDILVIPHALGQKLDFVQNEGPRLDPITDAAALAKLSLDQLHARLAPVYEALRLTRAKLAPEKTLIGFAGAPWTVACYMIDGQGGASGGGFAQTRAMAQARNPLLDRLMAILVEATAEYLSAQITAGADVVQLFDSWAGLLPDAESYERYVIHPSRAIVTRLREKHRHTPIIGFPRGSGERYAAYVAATGVNGLGLDQGVPLGFARETLGRKATLQGNLDPLLLLAGGKRFEDEVRLILDTFSDHPFIFNLGHGIDKETPITHVERLVSLIREHKQ
jgi:uroporphyrinogen decarboxylase